MPRSTYHVGCRSGHAVRPGYPVGVGEDQWLGGYRLIRRLGTGGAGTVWLAEDGGGSRVALKMLHPALADTERARARLTREATTVNRVRSSGVAHVVDVETEATQPFVVSEFIEGPTLATRLRSGAMPAREVAALAESLRHILTAVHDAGIVHRDVKPSNVILSPTGPVLIDFGIAQDQSDERLTTTGMVSGTAGFAAPELLRGGAPSSATDWWAWAATVLDAATGRPPFGTGRSEAVAVRTLEGRPDVEGLPREVARALAAALSVAPPIRPVPDDVCAVLSDPPSWRGPVVRSGSDEGAPSSQDGGAEETAALTGAAAIDRTARVSRTEVLAQGPEPDSAPWDVGDDDRTDLFAASPLPDGAPPDEAGDGRTAVLGDPREAWPAPTRALPLADGEATMPIEAAGAGAPDQTAAWPAAAAPSWSPPADPGLGPPPPMAQAGQTGAWPPSSPEQGMAGPLWPPVELPAPYLRRRPRRAPVVGLFLLAALAAPPVVAASGGVIATLAILLVLTALGAGHGWRERRREPGGPRASDTPMTLAAAPRHLLVAAAQLVLGLAVGLVAATIAWLAIRQGLADPPPLTWPLEALGRASANYDTGSRILDPVLQPALWLLVLTVLLAAWALPTTASLRDGVGLAVETLLEPLWARIVLCVLIAAILGATWLITTGGL